MHRFLSKRCKEIEAVKIWILKKSAIKEKQNHSLPRPAHGKNTLSCPIASLTEENRNVFRDNPQHVKIVYYKSLIVKTI